MNHSRKTIPSADSVARICITGGIACGKSLVGSMLADLGVAVMDADEVCRERMKTGGPLFKSVISFFGKRLVGNDGEINRSALGRLVFSDAEKLKALNRLIHPEVIRVIEAWMDERARGSFSSERNGVAPCWCAGVAAIIPLVYEVGWDKAWDRIICVGAPVAIQVERLKTRGLTEAEARQRIGVQLPVEEKMRRADYVIFNAGTQEAARRQTIKVFQNIVEHVEKKHG